MRHDADMLGTALSQYAKNVMTEIIEHMNADHKDSLILLARKFAGIEAEEGEELDIQVDKVTNTTTGKTFDVVRLPEARQAIIDAGGLIPYTRKRLLETVR